MGCLCDRPFATEFDYLPKRKFAIQKEQPQTPSIYFKESLDDFFCVYDLTEEVLARGPYSEARVCIHKRTHEKRCVKVILRKGIYGEIVPSQMLQKMQVLQELDHPNIIHTYEYFEDAKHFYFVEELWSGQGLLEMLSKQTTFSEAQAAHIMEQVFSALNYLHARGVVHRDIKPDNLIIISNTEAAPLCKLIDFDTATFCTVKRQLRGSVGSVQYMAPEVLTQSYDEKCDLWSCGVLLYLLLSSTPPFPSSSYYEFLHSVSKAQVFFEEDVWTKISPEAKSLISQLLVINPVVRIGAQQACEHLWITTHGASNTDSLPIETLDRIRSFHKSTKLMEAMHTFIIFQIIAYEDLRELSSAFRALDLNGDGYIDQGELLKVYLSFMNPLESRAEVSHIFREIDLDNNGYIEYSEFLRATIDHKLLLSQKNLKDAFDMFDSDGTGLITTKELKQLFQNNDYMDEEKWIGLIREVEQTKHGEIDLFEFEALLKSRIQ